MAANVQTITPRVWKWIWWVLGISMALWLLTSWLPRQFGYEPEGKAVVAQSGKVKPEKVKVSGKLTKYDRLYDFSDVALPSNPRRPLYKGEKTAIIIPSCNGFLKVTGKAKGFYPPRFKPADLIPGQINQLERFTYTASTLYGLFWIVAEEDCEVTFILKPYQK